MSISHRTNRLKLVGSPAVEQLQNGRYQLTINCAAMNSREDWYSSNKERIFPDFGSLQSAEMSIDGLSARSGEAYKDMGLISVQSSTQGQQYIVTLVYATLGASFVKVKDDTVSYTETGLRKVTINSIAKAGTEFQKTIGTDFINSQIDEEEEVTCFLASYEVDDNDSFREVTETYMQSGVISRNISERSNGKIIIETVQAFNETPVAQTTGAVQIGNDLSNVSGIPTRQFTFAKGDGQISVDTRPSDSRFKGCQTVTVTSVGSTAIVPTGVLISSSERESDGYVTHERTAIQGTLEQVTQTYTDVVAVQVPGEVLCTQEDVSMADSTIDNLSGTIAIQKVTPIRTKKVAATVTVEVTTNPPGTTDLAYDLGDISCSVTSISKNYSSRNGPTNYTRIGKKIAITTPYTDWQRSFAPSARIQTYPGCFLTGTGSSNGEVSYQSALSHRFEADQDEDGFFDGLKDKIFSYAVQQTECIGEGSTAATGYATTGILKRESRPILTDLDGTTYYEVITWSV
jgi:hypothetical protein|tara:strand:- start:1314 stop:2861 length:1548 start_codon:yes stop_codon:yes gene_type:complete